MKVAIEIPEVYAQTETQWNIQIKKQGDSVVADYISMGGVCHEEFACEILDDSV